MGKDKPDIEADIEAVLDRGESATLMEPLLISAGSAQRGELTDLALELASKSARLSSSLPSGVSRALAELVRAMNCYYSNLIEGHDTHPIDIERALKGDYSKDKLKRDLQLEAEAHIAVQRWIDEGGMAGHATNVDQILAVHKQFYENVPDDLKVVADASTGKKLHVVPGQLRQRDVAVGEHVAVSSGAVPRFLSRYENVYSHLGKSETVISAAAAHHRLLWIHPFLDGNGRVARLISYAQLWNTLETGGVWSIARGLARSESEYKRHLSACDQSRRGDLDGRGNLSEIALVNFSRFFLKTCIDQVDFMAQLVQPDQLRERLVLWVEEEIRIGKLLIGSRQILEAVLYRGEVPRGDVAQLLGVGDRQGRRVVSALIECEVLVSTSDRSPLKLAFPAALASRWMPGLFPDKPRS